VVEHRSYRDKRRASSTKQPVPNMDFTIFRNATKKLAFAFVLCFTLNVSIVKSQQATLTASAENETDDSIADDWGNDFFDVVGNVAPDPSERPKKIELVLPETLAEATPVENSLSPELVGWIRWLVLQNIPESYEDNKQWGKQKAVFEKLDIDIRGLRIDSEKKYKKVNQGTWTRYFIELVDPAEKLKFEISNLTQPRPGTMRYDVAIQADLHLFGRLSQWQRDIQLISISANADATAKLNATCEVDVVMNPLKVPPDIEFRPKVIAAHLELVNFRVHRISQIGGPLAKHLGNNLREILEDKLRDYDDKLVEKINKQIAKQQDKLHLSLQDWVSSRVGDWVTPTKK
jgi:hypothetical protein